MSNALAIAATTATLRNMLLRRYSGLDAELSDLEVTTQPPDLARKEVSQAQLNLFLYQTVVNGAWRNMDMPRQVRPGETAAAPAAAQPALSHHGLWARRERQRRRQPSCPRRRHERPARSSGA